MPLGSFFVGPETVDTTTTDGNCVYPPAPLGGAPEPTTVMVGGSPLLIYTLTSVLAPVGGVKVNPLIPLPCQIGVRTIRPTVNTTVFINGKLAAVTGDQSQLPFGSPRPLTGPFPHPTIVIGSNLTP